MRVERLPTAKAKRTARGPRRRAFLLAASAATLALIGASSASAATLTLTVGNPLTATFSSNAYSEPLTLLNDALPEPGAKVTSPVSGTIVRWRILDASGGPFRLRVFSPVSGTTYTAVATSSPQSPSGTGLQTFSTNLPITAGQTIALDNTNASDRIGTAGVAGASSRYWKPPLADGSTRAADGSFPGFEYAFNADVTYTACVVPNLKGKRLKKAKNALKAANCSRGKVTKKKHHKGGKHKTRKVKGQSPKVGTVLPAGSKVSIKLS